MAEKTDKVEKSDTIDKAIEALVSSIARPGTAPDPDKALKFSQSALNLAHVKSILAGIP